jgi:hypothetical protein
LIAVDRVVLRGIFISTVAAAGITYEVVKMSPPRWPLIAGYALITGLALFRILNRPPVQGREQTSNNP